ncbi:protein of unknown function [Vibrio tapetis subsp. tapetis]|uniref:Uncharacterized protein n=1 Tax=Vibrio tapetis subsp. tapetis TaxID=1671868 RepID=A0A2N8ZIA3_9VIBR|nr:protein of unknown function [Vibrio tapetis subsp. tapetis]
MMESNHLFIDDSMLTCGWEVGSLSGLHIARIKIHRAPSERNAPSVALSVIFLPH